MTGREERNELNISFGRNPGQRRDLCFWCATHIETMSSIARPASDTEELDIESGLSSFFPVTVTPVREVLNSIVICGRCALDEILLAEFPVWPRIKALRDDVWSGNIEAFDYQREEFVILTEELGVSDRLGIPEGVREEIASFVTTEQQKLRTSNEPVDEPMHLSPGFGRDIPSLLSLSHFRGNFARDLFETFTSGYLLFAKDDILRTWHPASETFTASFGLGEFVDMVGSRQIGPRTSMWFCLRQMNIALKSSSTSDGETGGTGTNPAEEDGE